MSTNSAARRLFFAGVLLMAGPVCAQSPMSAIDWLSRSVTAPAVAVPKDPTIAAPLGAGAQPGIDVSVLRATQINGLGLLPAKVTGLPEDLWGASSSADLVALLNAEPIHMLPQLQDLLYTLLLVEVDAPADAGASGSFLLARIDKLLQLGALDQAQALLALTGTRQPAFFRRWFDVELLLGQEDVACKTMGEHPEVAPTFPARIFCLARNGDWDAARLTLSNAEALGLLKPTETTLLTRFLDTESDDTATQMAPPAHPTPLTWRMMEAIGEPLPTNTLPLAFAQADLRDNTGWKAQIEAAERLARTGAVSPNRLIGIYTAGKPSASGEPWDRIAAVQKFDAGLHAKSAVIVARTLPAAWSAMSAAGLEVPFATLYGKALSQMKLPPKLAALAFRIGLLSPDYAVVAATHTPVDATEAFLIGLARGTPSTAPNEPMALAIAAAFTDTTPLSDDLAALVAEHKPGEAILHAIKRISDGSNGDLRGVTAGLQLLRQVGQVQAAERVALELMLLDRQG